MNSKEKILRLMKEEIYKPLTLEELALHFEINPRHRKTFEKIITDMEKEGQIIQTRKNRYGTPEKMNLVSGAIQGHAKGFAFVIPENPEIPDVFISKENMNGAMNGDKVIARLTDREHKGKKKEGEVIRILSRANGRVVGTYEASRHFGFVVPDDPRLGQDIFIPKGEALGASSGHKVVVEITEWPTGRRNPEGKIVEIIGFADSPGTDILVIIKKHQLPENFPEAVLKEAEGIPEQIQESDLKGRLDLRDEIIVTIDGEDAKDLDDAVSIEKLPNGNHQLGVHIADVSYYVKEGSNLDKEAFNRGTSVYLVDRVIPMLPPRLSNGICSLNPQVERLTMSCIMEIDNNGDVKSYTIKPSVINAIERMTYTAVNKIIVDNDDETISRYSTIKDKFKLMEELQKILFNKRIRRGAVDFDFPEAKIILDESGKSIDVKLTARQIAERMIEEFMIVANETVAEHVYWLNLPFIFRIHENPDSEKISDLNEVLHNFGYHIKGSGEIKPKAIQDVIEKVKGTKEEKIINTIILRSMKQAKYSHVNVEHFGLASKFYSHFTSPIRRYPDLIVHRVLRESLKGQPTENKIKKMAKNMAKFADQSSIRERKAVDAERETNDLKKVEFMSNKVGEVFDGIISSVTSFGLFVELDNTIEGLVHVSFMVDDYYIYDEKHYTLIGERTKKTYRIGDKVKVKLTKANLQDKNLDFEIVNQL